MGSQRCIHVIGMSPDGALSDAARAMIDNAEVIIGPPRHQFSASNMHALNLDYPSPLRELQNMLDAHKDKRVVILASGDPLLFGIGDWLGRTVGRQHLTFHPATSSVQTAFARIGQPWQHAKVVTLHGRPLDSLRSQLVANQWYALLTDKHSQPRAIAELLHDVGMNDAQLWIAEALGLAEEKISHFTTHELLHGEHQFHPLHVTLLKTESASHFLPQFPGIDDAAFDTGESGSRGMISKKAVRLNILALLSPGNGDIGWDVGAGCGGVAIEWARWNPQGQLYAIEKSPQRFGHLQTNQLKFGVTQNLHCILGSAPDVLDELDDPDVIFVGGNDGQSSELLNYCWSRLKSGGRLVASGVTEQTRAALIQFADAKQFELLEIAVAKSEPLGKQLLLRPQLPVLLMKVIKP
ncbi:MAG: precorrin-6y C5,15-methyltransferase (decarboxylating) subunit CbiE [Gammaproteobacteria bacterium]|nr:precorrin-6y C5,15-methyltransferase (decarboxylating) subunit CbiE [Gammaproteobacteria bacterium]